MQGIQLQENSLQITTLDITKLIKFSNYAKKMGFSRQWIYMLAKEGKLSVVEIDKVKFILL